MYWPFTASSLESELSDKLLSHSAAKCVYPGRWLVLGTKITCSNTHTSYTTAPVQSSPMALLYHITQLVYIIIEIRNKHLCSNIKMPDQKHVTRYILAVQDIRHQICTLGRNNLQDWPLLNTSNKLCYYYSTSGIISRFHQVLSHCWMNYHLLINTSQVSMINRYWPWPSLPSMTFKQWQSDLSKLIVSYSTTLRKFRRYDILLT